MSHGPVMRWTPEPVQPSGPRPRSGPVDPGLARELVDLQMRNIVTGVQHLTSHDTWRHVVFVSDPAHVTVIRRLFAPVDVTIETSPWSALTWQSGFDALEHLQHLARFSSEVHDGRPQLVLSLTRPTQSDAEILQTLPRGMLRFERLLVRPDHLVR